MNRPNILVLGGTGVMGCFLAQRLAQDYEVVVTTRSKKIDMPHLKYRQGNAHDISFITKVLEESSNSFKAIVDFMNYSTNEFKQRYELLLSHTDQLVFISSARVYADSKIPIVEGNKRLLDVSDDIKFLASDDYALAKARQEDILIASDKKNWTIVRPYITFSSKKLDLGIYSKELWLYRVLKGRTVVFPEDISKSVTTLTYGEDVAKAIVSLISNKAAMGNIFHITTKESMRWNDILAIYKKTLNQIGIQMKVIMQPKYEIKASNIYRYDRLYNRVFDNTKIDDIYDTSLFESVETGIQKSLDFFLKKPEWGQINWSLQAYMDRISRERTPLNEIELVKDKLLYIFFRYFISYPVICRVYLYVKHKMS